MAIAGKVAPTYEEEWSETTAYQQHTYVRYNGDCYVSKKPSTGIVPTNEEYWFLALKNVTQEQYNALVNGTTPAGNASKLENLTAKQVGESGARNLIPYPYYNTTKTTNGITFTDNGDGTVTVNGTATANTFFDIIYKTEIKLLAKPGQTITYKCGVQSPTLVSLRFIKTDETAITYKDDTGNGFTTVVPEGTESFYTYIYVPSGTTVNNLTVKPMLELGSIAHDFVPYHFGGAEDALTLNGLTAEEFVLLDSFLKAGFYNPMMEKTHWDNIEKTTSLTTTFFSGWASSEMPYPWGVGVIIPTNDFSRKFIVYFAQDNNIPRGIHLGYMSFTDTTTYTIAWKDLSDADTVDGYHASDFAKTVDFLSGTDFSFMQNRSGTNHYRLQLQNGAVSLWESTDSGATWTRKATFDKDCLPLTGGTLSGSLFANGGYTAMQGDNNHNALYTNNVAGSIDDGRALMLFNTNYTEDDTSCLQIWKRVNSSITNIYSVLHTGISAKVVQATSAPSDTTAVWIDTANKVIKAYIDGAWTQVS